MLTIFGKFCRKLRIDRNELLKDMAVKLGVSPAYLSAVEMGKREIPEGWFDLIVGNYSLNAETAEELENAINLSRNVIKLNLKKSSPEDKELAVMFARKFDQLDEVDKEELKKKLLSLFK